MDEKKELLTYLKENRLMSLATICEKGPWMCTVFYAVSDEFALYFVSHDGSEHVSHIRKNNQIALSIGDTNQFIEAKKSGVQMRGTAEILEQGEEHAKALQLWLAAVGGYKDAKILEDTKIKVMSGLLLKVTPSRAKYLDEKKFGEYIAKEIAF